MDSAFDPFENPLRDDHRRRLRQIFRYLEAHWPSNWNAHLVIARIGPRRDAVAIVEPMGGALRMTIDSRHSYQSAVDCLLHEWAHVVTWDAIEDHGGAWSGVFAAIVSAFEDGDAFEDSRAW